MQNYSLEELGLVDSEAEPAFDNLTTLASTILGVPVSLLSFVQLDKDRQYFKSRVGLDIQQTPLSHSFCRTVVDSNSALIVEDARVHPLVCNNLAIADLGVIAYLGFPVTNPDGEAIASFCVIETQPRQWSEQDKRTVASLAACATDAVRLRYEIKNVEVIRQEQRLFTDAIAHDMTAPLNTVTYVMNEILEEYESVFSDEFKTMIKMTAGTVDRAREKIGDIMVYSQSMDCDFTPEDVDLNELINETRETLQGDIVKMQAEVVTEAMPVIQGSRVQLAMLFQNLVGNALKFQKATEAPRIHVSAKVEGRNISICFSDNGIGISSQHRARIFNLFERLHDSKQFAGSGVGLALVQRVAINHHGSVSVNSDGENGSAFTIHLPRSVSEAA